MGLALANAAKHKLVGLLAERLKADGVYVGEVMIAGAVKGTPYADRRRGHRAGAASQASSGALYKGRGEIYARVS